MEIKSDARLRWFGLLKRESIGKRMLRPKLPGGSFIDVARGKLDEEVPEEGLNANSWSAVLNPKAKGRNNTIFQTEKKNILLLSLYIKCATKFGGKMEDSVLTSC